MARRVLPGWMPAVLALTVFVATGVEAPELLRRYRGRLLPLDRLRAGGEAQQLLRGQRLPLPSSREQGLVRGEDEPGLRSHGGQLRRQDPRHGHHSRLAQHDQRGRPGRPSTASTRTWRPWPARRPRAGRQVRVVAVDPLAELDRRTLDPRRRPSRRRSRSAGPSWTAGPRRQPEPRRPTARKPSLFKAPALWANTKVQIAGLAGGATAVGAALYLYTHHNRPRKGNQLPQGTQDR